MKVCIPSILMCMAAAAAPMTADVDAAAPPARLHTALSAGSYCVGEPFDMDILVSGTDAVEQPSLNHLRDFAVRLKHASPLSARGKVGYVLRYELIPRRAGDLTIPPITIKVGGELQQTQTVPLTVGTPQSYPGLRLEVAADVRECFVGQAFVVRGTWYSTLPFHRFRDVHIEVPVFHHPAFRVAVPPPVVEDAGGRGVGLPVSDMRIIAQRGHAELDGQPCEALHFERVVLPLRPGTFAFPPSALAGAVVAPEASRPLEAPSYFKNNFFEPAGPDGFTRYAAASAPLTVSVKALPEDGRPPDFVGQVGACTVRTTAAPSDVNVGDPVTLTVTVSGAAFPAMVVLPDLSVQPAFARNFTLPAKPPTVHVDDDRSVFVLALRPLRADVSEIPPVRIPFFDPAAQRYGVARSEPIPVVVRATATTTAFDADFTGSPQLRNELRVNRDGIRHNANATDALVSKPDDPAWLLALAVAIPPLVFLVFAGITSGPRLARRDPAAARARLAMRRFRKQLGPLLRGPARDDWRRPLDGAVRAYFGAKLHLTPQATCEEVLAALRRRLGSDQDVSGLERIYRVCDRQRFARRPEPVDGQELAAQAMAVVRGIDRRLDRPAQRGRLPLLLGVLALGSLSCAAGEPDSAAICREANALFERANRAALSDPDQARDLYGRAALKYRFLVVERGIHTAPLHTNLGNAYFFSGDIGLAILNYHRALRCNPADADVRHNLRYVRSLCIDELPRSRLKALLAGAVFWHQWPLPLRLSLFLLAYVGVWTIAGLLLYRTSRLRWWLLGACSVLAVVLLASTTVTAFRLLEPVDGVIVAKEITARHGDGYIYESAFSSPLHAGTEFSLLETRGQWYRIALRDGSPCWVPAHAAALVSRPTNPLY